jgi:hypothetical protein
MRPVDASGLVVMEGIRDPLPLQPGPCLLHGVAGLDPVDRCRHWGVLTAVPGRATPERIVAFLAASQAIRHSVKGVTVALKAVENSSGA